MLIRRPDEQKEVGREIHKSLTNSAICGCLIVVMADNAGLNRRRNRQHDNALAARRDLWV
jgi:hypothetical protein